MEGPLSKWTNVIEGWQYRWFVLDESAGVLTYYTSKEKMLRGQRRGCVRLKGAVVGIDDEDDSTFTITVDQKMFHFQARDADERDRWIRALEGAIQRRSGYRFRNSSKGNVAAKKALGDFERRIGEADAYLQLIIDQIKEIEAKLVSTESESERKTLQVVVQSANALLDSVKHSIVLLQIAKSQLAPQQPNAPVVVVEQSESSRLTPVEIGVDALEKSGHPDGPDAMLAGAIMPSHSYSSSDEGSFTRDEEDEYFDTVEYSWTDADEASCVETAENEEGARPHTSPMKPDNSATGGNPNPHSRRTAQQVSSAPHGRDSTVEPNYGDEGTDFDAIYEEDSEDELGSVQEHGSVVMHLLSQLSVGMDLTKITLPTFILERRSLLEMFADFFAHPDLFTNIADCHTPEERMVAVVKWYLSSFHAGRKSSVAKKPYNPILGETFRCRWDVPGLSHSQENESDGSPLVGARSDQLTFIAEQVSHHPPVSAFYAEHPEKRLQLDAHIWTKSKFLGLSIAVHMVGQACLSVLEYDEEYILTFPSGYGRSILTTPWVELCGKCYVKCEKTGYHSDIEFLAKPFYGGRAHNIKADVYRPASSSSTSVNKNPFMTIKGQWNGVMTAKTPHTGEEVFLDVRKLPPVSKNVSSIVEQTEYESRRLWRHVTAALKRKDVQQATKAKQWLEQRQRNEAKERAATNTKWQTICFQESGEHWIYRWPLCRRPRHSSQT